MRRKLARGVLFSLVEHLQKLLYSKGTHAFSYAKLETDSKHR